MYTKEQIDAIHRSEEEGRNFRLQDPGTLSYHELKKLREIQVVGCRFQELHRPPSIFEQALVQSFIRGYQNDTN